MPPDMPPDMGGHGIPPLGPLGSPCEPLHAQQRPSTAWTALAVEQAPAGAPGSPGARLQSRGRRPCECITSGDFETAADGVGLI